MDGYKVIFHADDKGSIGHTYAELVHPEEGSSFYGFYPAERGDPIWNDGAVVDDRKRYEDALASDDINVVSAEYDLRTEALYEQARDYIIEKQENPDDYFLMKANCNDFIQGLYEHVAGEETGHFTELFTPADIESLDPNGNMLYGDYRARELELEEEARLEEAARQEEARREAEAAEAEREEILEEGRRALEEQRAEEARLVEEAQREAEAAEAEREEILEEGRRALEEQRAEEARLVEEAQREAEAAEAEQARQDESSFDQRGAGNSYNDRVSDEDEDHAPEPPDEPDDVSSEEIGVGEDNSETLVREDGAEVIGVDESENGSLLEEAYASSTEEDSRSDADSFQDHWGGWSDEQSAEPAHDTQPQDHWNGWSDEQNTELAHASQPQDHWGGWSDEQSAVTVSSVSNEPSSSFDMPSSSSHASFDSGPSSPSSESGSDSSFDAGSSSSASDSGSDSSSDAGASSGADI